MASTGAHHAGLSSLETRGEGRACGSSIGSSMNVKNRCTSRKSRAHGTHRNSGTPSELLPVVLRSAAARGRGRRGKGVEGNRARGHRKRSQREVAAANADHEAKEALAGNPSMSRVRSREPLCLLPEGCPRFPGQFENPRGILRQCCILSRNKGCRKHSHSLRR